MKILITFLVLLNAICYAQNKNETVKIGFKVPDVKFELLNYSNPQTKLSDFKGKVILLDFWATWCSACIDNFPHLDSLQNEFKSSMQIILVNSIEGTGDTKIMIQNFMKRQDSIGHPIRLVVAVEDKDTKALFPRSFLPHYVWLDKQGKLRAVTTSEFVTKENILKMIDRSN